MNQLDINLLVLFVILGCGIFVHNPTIWVSATALIIIKFLPHNQPIFSYIQQYGLNLGILLLTIAVIAPIASEQVSSKALMTSFASWRSLLAIAVGLLVTWLGARGVNLMKVDPNVVTGLMIGTVAGVVLFRGVARYDHQRHHPPLVPARGLEPRECPYRHVFFVPSYAVFPHPRPATAVGWFLPVGTQGHGDLRHTLACASSPAGRRPVLCIPTGRACSSVLIQRRHRLTAAGVVVRSPALNTGWLPAALGGLGHPVRVDDVEQVAEDQLLVAFVGVVFADLVNQRAERAVQGKVVAGGESGEGGAELVAVRDGDGGGCGHGCSWVKQLLRWCR